LRVPSVPHERILVKSCEKTASLTNDVCPWNSLSTPPERMPSNLGVGGGEPGMRCVRDGAERENVRLSRGPPATYRTLPSSDEERICESSRENDTQVKLADLVSLEKRVLNERTHRRVELFHTETTPRAEPATIIVP
jgi:hypothetical protein